MPRHWQKSFLCLPERSDVRVIWAEFLFAALILLLVLRSAHIATIAVKLPAER